LACLISVHAALTQALQVMPVTLTVPYGAMTTTLMVTNEGDEPATIQLRTFAWSQTRQDDALTPSDVLMVSPPIVEVPAGQTQIVRLVLRKPASAEEASYRVLVDEIPMAATGTGVRIALRFSIPLFAESKADDEPHLTMRIANKNGASWLVVTNDGRAHQRLVNLKLALPGGDRVSIEHPGNPYILPGVTRWWRLTSALRPGGTAELTAASSNGPIDRTLPVCDEP
jgi:fimbrial chaperone protein